MHVCVAQTAYQLIIYQINRTWFFPSWADEIAKPHPDMIIKVSAFTVTQKFYNSCNHFFGEQAIDTHVWRLDDHTCPNELPFVYHIHPHAQSLQKAWQVICSCTFKRVVWVLISHELGNLAWSSTVAALCGCILNSYFQDASMHTACTANVGKHGFSSWCFRKA